MKALNIYLCGVGGQGIGLLAEVLGQACLVAGYTVKGCDTHGLAQRGGTVVSHLRIGERLHAPLVPPREADLVVSLERLEAIRALNDMLRPGGTVVYYDSVYQPIHVRMGLDTYPAPEAVEAAAAPLQARVERVSLPALPDPRMQNVALLGRVAALGLIEGVGLPQIDEALASFVAPRLLEANRQVLAEGAAR